MKNLAELEEFEMFSNLEIIARQVVEGFLTGLHRSPYHGFSVEFAEHRHYNTGESIKHIDWKLYGRTEKLYVKRYEEETNLKAHILIDVSSSMLFPYPSGNLHNKLFFSIYSAAALIRLLRSQRDAVGLHLFSDTLEFQSFATLSSAHSQHLYNQLSALLDKIKRNDGQEILNRTTQASSILHQLAETLPKRSLVILFSDMLDSENQDDLFSALQHFRYNQNEVLLFHVMDESFEERFDYPSKPHRFIDMESGEQIRLNPADIRNDYHTLMKKHLSEIKLRCGQYGVDLSEARIQKDFKEVLLPFLVKRKKMY